MKFLSFLLKLRNPAMLPYFRFTIHVLSISSKSQLLIILEWEIQFCFTPHPLQSKKKVIVGSVNRKKYATYNSHLY